MTARKYRKKPVVIEALQWDGANIEAMWEWASAEHIYHMADTNQLKILTLEGDIRADVGDWIIEGVKGEFYPCKNEIFLATYDAVEDEGLSELREAEAP